MKMLFVYPDLQTHQFAHIQHGIASISAVLRAAGHQTDLLWIREKWTEEQFLQAVQDRSPDLVGFSSNALQWLFARDYARTLKAARPDLPLVIGGVHATLVPDQVWAERIFDVLCLGEGEYPMRDLLEALSRGRDYRRIPNLWVRDGEAVIQNPLRSWINPLDELPFPDRSIWENDLVLGENDHEAALMASRGCPYACTYCSNSALRRLEAGGPHVRLKSPEYVIAEIADLTRRYDVRSLFFEDEIFTLKRAWVDRFCELYRAQFKIPFIIYVRQELVDRSILETLREAGCTEIKLGVETGNERLRREVLGRKTTNEQIIRFYRLAHELGLKTWIFNMVGIPGDTPETIAETMDLNREIRANHVQVTMFYPFPGTPLYELCRREGYLADHDSPSVFYEHSILQLPTITREELHQAFVRFRRLAFEIMAERAAQGYYDFCHHFPEARVETENPDYVQLMPVRVEGKERMSVLAHPPARVAYRVVLRPHSRLRFGLAFSPTVWDQPGGGTTFEIWVRRGRWRSRRVFEKMIDPKHRIEDRRWHDHEIPLGDGGGRPVEITLVTRTPPGENQYCVAVWSRPHLVEPE